ncbi:MAG: transglycosylase domain-containing protein [Prevotella sp.]|nr:transglycosylase domain-containing protein [Prevotella sp.]
MSNHHNHHSQQRRKTLWGKAWHAVKSVFGWYIGLFKGRPWYVKLLSAIVSVVVAFVLYLGAVDTNFLWLFGKSPSMQTIKNKRPSQASEIYSDDGVMIGKFFSENRTPVEYDDVEPVFWQALIDTEDVRFYNHHGVDFQAFLAVLKDYVLHHDARGASTITQQLAKNLFRTRSEYSTGLLGNIPGLKMLIMKSKEWITAFKLEATFSKQEILTMYANTVDFGSNAFGIKTACKTYFNNTPKTLRVEQAAVLVGMLKATTFYNPRIHPDNALKRRNVVLSNMVEEGHLTAEQFDSLKAIEIDISDYNVENAYDGQATYFREAVAAYLRDWCRDNGYDLYTDGLKIYTTIDTRMQKYAEEAAREQMRQVQKNFENHWGKTNPWQNENHVEIPRFIEGLAQKLPYYKQLVQRFPNEPDSVIYYMNKPHPVKLFTYDGPEERMISTMDSIRYMERFMHCGFVAMEPNTGNVKAWVGDVDFDTWKYDKVTAMRQPGSTFKLFVYAEAMNQGLSPCDKRRDSYVAMKVYDKGKGTQVTWAPTNANGYFTNDSMPLKVAFAQSVNSIAVKLGQEVGIDNVANTAMLMGIKSELDATPSLALGSSDVNLLELVNAYTTAVNDGKMHDPVLVAKILDRDGNEIYTAPTQQRQAIPYRSAYLLQQLLQGGLREPGATSMSLWGYVRDFAKDTEFGGKTGTSNNHSDAWFVGVSPKLVCGAWVGGEYRCIHFRTGALGQGSRTALPICGLFYKKVLSDSRFKHYRGKFAKPKDGVPAELYTCSSYSVRTTPDSLATDSLELAPLDGGVLILDSRGNPVLDTREYKDVPRQQAPADGDATGSDAGTDKPAEKKPKQQPVYEDVYL